MRRILLADADAFYVAVARAVDPEGAGKAPLLIVGGSRDSRGVVCSASYETRKFGVRSAMPIARALRLCPDAVCVPVPFKACLQKSAEIRELLHRYSPIVEGASVDEWYLDLTGTEGVYRHEPLATTAQRIRAGIREATGLTLSIGGGTNKLIAKMAVDRAKPSRGGAGVLIVEPGAEDPFLRTCALGDIPLVGPKFQERLAAHGLVMVEDLLRHDLATLERWMSKREARWLWNRAHGFDDGSVAHRVMNRGLSRDETFGKDLHKDADIERELLRLDVCVLVEVLPERLVATQAPIHHAMGDAAVVEAVRAVPQPARFALAHPPLEGGEIVPQQILDHDEAVCGETLLKLGTDEGNVAERTGAQKWVLRSRLDDQHAGAAAARLGAIHRHFGDQLVRAAADRQRQAGRFANPGADALCRRGERLVTINPLGVDGAGDGNVERIGIREQNPTHARRYPEA